MSFSSFLSDIIDSGFVSPGSIGGKIKRFREAKGLTQKQLGILCGFKEESADVRIAQYEKNKKTPKYEMLCIITEALGVDIEAFFDGDLFEDNKVFHALFDLEDIHSLRPVKVNGSYYLTFGGYNMQGRMLDDGRYMRNFLKEWYEKRVEYKMDSAEKLDDSERKRLINEYVLWKGGYIKNSYNERSERIDDKNRMDALQEEIDSLNAKMNSSSELKRIDDAVTRVMPEVKKGYIPIKKESEFVLYIIDQMLKGMHFTGETPDGVYKMESDLNHLFSVPTEEILGKKENIEAYAYLLCMIKTLQEFGIKIERFITSKDKVLYITFMYDWHFSRNFKNLEKIWYDTEEMVRHKEDWAPWEVESMMESIRLAITEERDVVLPAPMIEFEE